MKRIIALLASAALMLSVTGCAQSAGSQNNPAPASQTPSSQGSGSSAQSSKGTGNGVTEITFWHSMDGVFADVTKKQVDLFNQTVGAQKGIHVTPVFQDYPGTNALTAAMATDDVKNMPDVIQLYGESVSLVRNYKRTVWAEDCMNDSGSALKKKDLIPNAVSAFSIKGKMIGVPWTVSSLLLYYNQDDLDKIGAKVPKTISEMASILPNLVHKAGAKYGLNVKVSQYELQNWIATQGPNGTYFGDNESGHSDYMTKLACTEDSSLKKFLNEWDKVAKSGAYKATSDSMNNEFAKGLNAMAIMSSSKIPTIKKLVGNSFKWGVAPIPKVDGNDIGGAYPSGSGLFMLDRGDSAKKAAAWEFVQFMASPEAQVLWMGGAGYVPVNVSTLNQDAYKAAIAADPRLQVPYDTLMQAPEKVTAGFVPNSDTVDKIITNAMADFGKGSSTKDDAYKAIADGCTKAFADYYRTNPIK